MAFKSAAPDGALPLRADASERADILVVLASLKAEGTQRLALELCRAWKARGLRPAVLELGRGPDEVGGEFDMLSVPVFRHRFAESGHLRYLRLAAAVHGLCRSMRPGALLSMPSGIHAFIAMGAKLAGVPRVVVHQGVYPWHWKTRQFRKYRLEYRLGRPFTDCVVACSRYVEGGVRAHLDGGGREVRTVYNGVDVGRFLAAALTRVGERTEQTPKAVMVGRLDETKDFGTLISAIAVLAGRGIDIDCDLVGDGPARPLLERQAQEDGVSRRVRFLGPRQDVPEILAGADVFAYSVKPEEGLGIALIEAMAAGVPVVASDVPACREVLDDGALGVLVAPGDPIDLADGIQAVIEQRQTARVRVLQAREKVVAEFTADVMAGRYLDALGLGGDGGASAPSAVTLAHAGAVE